VATKFYNRRKALIKETEVVASGAGIWSLENWRERLGFEIGMPKEEAFEKFREWRSTKKTCQRCEGETYIDFCEIHLICEEADRVGYAEGNDNRGRIIETNEPEALRTQLFEARKRASIR
jgi:hypothetical protein